MRRCFSGHPRGCHLSPLRPVVAMVEDSLDNASPEVSKVTGYATSTAPPPCPDQQVFNSSMPQEPYPPSRGGGGDPFSFLWEIEVTCCTVRGCRTLVISYPARVVTAHCTRACRLYGGPDGAPECVVSRGGSVTGEATPPPGLSIPSTIRVSLKGPLTVAEGSLKYRLGDVPRIR